MNDLISRQAAIAHAVPLNLFGREVMMVSVSELENLPSSQPVANNTNVLNSDTISRQAAIDAIVNIVSEIGLHDNSEVARYGATFRQHEIMDIIKALPSAQPDIIHCRECIYGEQDDVGRWFCRGFGCQVGNEDGSGYCADAERRTDEPNKQTD